MSRKATSPSPSPSLPHLSFLPSLRDPRWGARGCKGPDLLGSKERVVVEVEPEVVVVAEMEEEVGAAKVGREVAACIP